MDVIERYLSSKLNDTEKQDFEEHYFECHDCFERLRIARALWMNPDFAERRRWTGFTFPSRLRSAAVAGLMAITVFGIVLFASKVLTHHENTNKTVRVVERPFGKVSSAKVFNAPLLQSFYPDVPVWSLETQDEARKQVSEAIAECREGNYVTGIEGLNIAATEADTSKTNLYVGVCYALAHQPDKAINQLKKAISANSPILAEQAHYYLACVYLQMNDPALAQQELELTLRFHGAMENDARVWLEKLDMNSTVTNAK